MIPERNKSNYKFQRFEMRNKFYKQQILTIYRGVPEIVEMHLKKKKKKLLVTMNSSEIHFFSSKSLCLRDINKDFY